MTRARAIGAGIVVAMLVAAACSSAERADDTGSRSSPSSTGAAPGTAPAPVISPAIEPTAETTHESLLTPDGRERSYHVYAPSALGDPDGGGGGVPLLVALHGGTGWGEQFEAVSGFDGLAQAIGFVVVYPDGVGVGPESDVARTWNGGRCCGVAALADIDDVAFVRLLIDRLSADYPIDPGRVFVTGHSNGAILSYRLACELSEVVAAIAVQSGSLEIDGCAPERPVSVLAIHRTEDANLPIDGGLGPAGISGVTFRSPRDAVRTLAAADGCPAEPGEVIEDGITTKTWTPCEERTEVRFVSVADAAHVWMGGPGARTPAEKGFDSSAEIWAFLADHGRS